ncbi:UNVERIFIED_CONTAM: hypothetical protein K2H54_003754 [Gekko kuhli]
MLLSIGAPIPMESDSRLPDRKEENKTTPGQASECCMPVAAGVGSQSQKQPALLTHCVEAEGLPGHPSLWNSRFRLSIREALGTEPGARNDSSSKLAAFKKL